MRVSRGKFVWTLTVPSTQYSCIVDIQQYIFTWLPMNLCMVGQAVLNMYSNVR
jgi:hypothetical protein